MTDHPPRLLDQVHRVMRLKHMSLRTEESCLAVADRRAAIRSASLLIGQIIQRHPLPGD